MKPLYNIYLLFIRSGLKNDTSFSQVVSVEEQAALAALAEEVNTVQSLLCCRSVGMPLSIPPCCKKPKI